jgi:hypothetical protein
MMSLPRLNDTPQYQVTIPSTKQTVRFRPYLVKEEKVLMMAFESQDPQQGLQAVVDTLMACISDPIDHSKLTTFDVEYLFVQIRGKSVGESSEVNVKCGSCKTSSPRTIQLDDIRVDVPRNANVIEVTKDVMLEMRYPSYKLLQNVENLKGIEGTETTFEFMAACIESIVTKDERIAAKDEPVSELIRFLESMTTVQFQKVAQFFEGIPKLSYDLEYKCDKCNHQETLQLRGLSDFF